MFKKFFEKVTGCPFDPVLGIIFLFLSASISTLFGMFIHYTVCLIVGDNVGVWDGSSILLYSIGTWLIIILTPIVSRYFKNKNNQED